MTTDATLGAEIVAGLGFRPGTEREDILACLEAALHAAGLPSGSEIRLATMSARAGEPGLVALAASRGAGIVAIPDEALRGMDAGCATRSTRVAGLFGVGSVAEAAALAAAGPGARLVLPRIATARVTCALAQIEPAAEDGE